MSYEGFKMSYKCALENKHTVMKKYGKLNKRNCHIKKLAICKCFIKCEIKI